MLPKKEIKNGLDDILKAVTETHRRGYNQPPTGYNQVNQPQPQGGELHHLPTSLPGPAFGRAKPSGHTVSARETCLKLQRCTVCLLRSNFEVVHVRQGWCSARLFA